MPEAEVADHAFLGGRLVLREPKRGHRSGTDAVLLAAAAPLRSGQHLVDVGAGAGGAALAVLCRVPDATATLIERDPLMADLARHNIVVNGFAARAEVVQADIGSLKPARELHGRLGDVVISNPPFYRAGTVRLSSVPQQVHSHVLDGMDHGDWAKHMLRMARPKGRAVIVHRPDALPSLLAAIGNRASVGLRAVHARDGELAIRLLISLSVGSRSPLTMAPAFTLHDAAGQFTSAADALHRGAGTL